MLLNGISKELKAFILWFTAWKVDPIQLNSGRKHDRCKFYECEVHVYKKHENLTRLQLITIFTTKGTKSFMSYTSSGKDLSPIGELIKWIWVSCTFLNSLYYLIWPEKVYDINDFVPWTPNTANALVSP